MNVLIVVDMQNDFLPGGSLAVPGGDQAIPVINNLIDRFDRVIGTQDWHPADHGSFAVNHPGKKEGETVDLHGLPQILWPVHCVQHSHGADFHKDLNTSRFEKIFVKGTDKDIDSYSGFYDNGHRKSTGLADYLRESDTEEVFITGLAADYCVKYTALDSIKEGFKTTVIEDATRAVNLNENDFEKSMDEMKNAGVRVIPFDKI